MYVFDDGFMPEPPEELLDQCFCIQIVNPTKKYNCRGIDIKRWAMANCKSMVHYSIKEYQHDHVYSYYFYDHHDVFLFRLRWPE